MFPRSDAFSCLISCKQSVKFLLGKIGSTHRCCSIFRTGVYQLTLGSPQPCTLALCRRFSASTCLHTLEKAWPPASSQALRVVLRACTCARVARGIRTDGMSRINATHTHTPLTTPVKASKRCGAKEGSARDAVTPMHCRFAFALTLEAQLSALGQSQSLSPLAQRSNGW